MRRLGLLLCILLVAVAASGCRKVMSEQVLEAMAEEQLLAVSGADVDVDCPSGVTMRAQDVFFCRTSIADRRGWVLVRQHDDYGRVTLERELPLDRDVIEPIVERYLARQYDLDVQVRCPGDVIQEPEQDFTCSVDGEADVDVRQVDGVDEYAINWRGTDRVGGAS